MLQAAKEIGEFLLHRKKWWLAPVIIVLALLGAVMAVSASSPLAPFIYTLF
ncbi:hypothetical protein HYV30_04410 [Candidatus Kaiserbacteria bacterium]|nr:hypothetical protein [Candidatus Kaiserbacteria bacterium]